MKEKDRTVHHARHLPTGAVDSGDFLWNHKPHRETRVGLDSCWCWANKKSAFFLVDEHKIVLDCWLVGALNPRFQSVSSLEEALPPRDAVDA